MSILHETTMSRLNHPRPGEVELRGGQVRAPLLFDGGSTLWLESREEILAVITSAQALLRSVDDAVWQLSQQPPAQAGHDGLMARPYTAPGPVPAIVAMSAAAAYTVPGGDVLPLDERALRAGATAARSPGAHAAPVGQAVHAGQGEAVVPGPSVAATAP